jgi:fucose permease
MPATFPLLATALSSALLAGILLTLGAALRRPLAERYGASETAVRRWAFAFHGLVVPMMLVNGLLLDKWGADTLLMLAAPCCAVALAWLALAKSLRVAGAALFVLAAGAAGLVLSACVLLLVPRESSSFEPVSAMNLAFLFAGFGMLLNLRLTGRLLEAISPRRFLLILALFCLLPAFLAMQLPPADTLAADDLGYWERLSGQPVFWLTLIALLFAGLLQGALTSWVGHYLAEVGISLSSGELILLAWWLMLLAGRLAGTVVLRPGFEVWALLALAILVASVIGNLIGADYAIGGVIGALLLALGLGPQIPTLLAVLAEPFHGQLGGAMGAALAAAAVGQIVFPPRFGPVATQPSLRVWLRLPLILALLLAAALLTLALVRSPV